ncbi:MAG: hypothetical protein U9Q71_09725 [Pseudomonadota bacterium]|nr:hypothetical protein [Pseudomonadota bacterium]
MLEQDAAPRRKKLLTGTRGWDYDDWVGVYYPEELPEEWRLAYYCNDHRSVLVPVDHWALSPAEAIAALIEEIDPGFSVVLELPEAGLSGTGLDAEGLLDLLSPMESQLRALSWRPAADDFSVQALDDAACLADALPLVLDYDDGHPQKEMLDALRAATGASRLWRPREEDTPVAAGQFLLALVSQPDLVFLRGILEQMAGRLAGDRSGGLFLEPAPDAPQFAEKCRILAELMEIQ